MNTVPKRVYLYDTTLRDGAQTQGVDFGVRDKQAIATELDKLGIDYIEGGWPGANPTDDAFFSALPKTNTSRFTAFGMTRKAGRSASNDPNLNALINVNVPAVCMVGKTWDFQVDVALNIPLEENIAMITSSVQHAVAAGKEVLFDAEHFFDGFKANPRYALQAITAAYTAGARWIVLCDTNGGTLPKEISHIVTEVSKHIPPEKIGIHCHNDTENAVANSLAAVEAGASMIQGTLNGLGERCGNANLVSLIPTLLLKMNCDIGIKAENLKHLTRVSRILDERLNRNSNRHAPYVGEAAFAHKGGLHVSAVAKNPACYEHINPADVGNKRHIVISDQAGRANVLARLQDLNFTIEPENPKIQTLVEHIKQQEYQGYSYDAADASFALVAHQHLYGLHNFYTLNSFRVIDERRWNAKGDLITLSEATVKVTINNTQYMSVAEGNGPVNALDAALRKVLLPVYPEMEEVQLVDYKVRILTPNAGTKALTRVMIESRDAQGESWHTIGVSTNVIDASYKALQDSIIFKLLSYTK